VVTEIAEVTDHQGDNDLSAGGSDTTADADTASDSSPQQAAAA
jgi:hypothetical protein